jgi:hypothetical protein
MNSIVDLQYFAPVILYKIANKSSNIVFEQCEYYQKMSFRNRCQIAGAEGLVNLSVPLEKGRDQKTLMRDVRISDFQPWQARHWKTIVSCYSRSPWFEFYRDDLERLYKKPFDFLIDWNRACFEWTAGILKMPVSMSLTEEYRREYEPSEWMDWRGRILPKNRGRDVVGGLPDAGAGGDSGDGSPLKYRQVFEERTGFIPNLSILDLLFCEGKRAAELLRGN